MPIAGGNELVNANFILDKIGVAPGIIFADLGCGAIGHFVFPAASRVGDKGKVYAVDIQKSVLSAIESRARTEGLLQISAVWSDLEKYGAAKIPDGSVDVALLANTLFQTKDRASMIKEAMRLLKSGGVLGIVEWKENAPQGLGPDHSLKVLQDAVEKTATSLGLTLKEKFDAGPYHYGLIFSK